MSATVSFPFRQLHSKFRGLILPHISWIIILERDRDCYKLDCSPVGVAGAFYRNNSNPALDV